MNTLDQYTTALTGALGAVAANSVVTSSESLKVLRDCSKLLDSLSIQLRKDLIEQSKQLTINHD